MIRTLILTALSALATVGFGLALGTVVGRILALFIHWRR